MVAVTTLFAADPYTEAMQTGMDQLSEAQRPEDFLKVSNTFARIAAVEQDKWLPAYYAAYSTTVYAAMNQDPKMLDSYLDKAQEYLDKASSVEENNAEILTLQSFIYMMRISVDPQSRGQEYSGKSGAALAKARKLDPENPRVMYLSAQLSYGTAQFFGQNPTEACGMIDQAVELFDSYSSDIPFYPSWGKKMALEFQERCK